MNPWSNGTVHKPHFQREGFPKCYMNFSLVFLIPYHIHQHYMYINTSIYNVPEFNLSFGSGYDEVDFNFSFIRFSWPLFRYNSALNLKKKTKSIIPVHKSRNTSITHYVTYAHLAYLWILSTVQELEIIISGKHLKLSDVVIYIRSVTPFQSGLK